MYAPDYHFIFGGAVLYVSEAASNACYAPILNSKTFPAGAKWLFSGASTRIA